MAPTNNIYYRNQGIKEMMERLDRVESNPTADLNINVNVDTILAKKGGMAAKMLLALSNKQPFVLRGGNGHAIVIPDKMAVVLYAFGIEVSRELATDVQSFQNRVRMLVAVYDEFVEVKPQIGGGKRKEKRISIKKAKVVKMGQRHIGEMYK